MGEIMATIAPGSGTWISVSTYKPPSRLVVTDHGYCAGVPGGCDVRGLGRVGQLLIVPAVQTLPQACHIGAKRW